MIDNNLRKLILYLAGRTHESGFPLTRLRLVKLLYLIDEIYYERKRKTLTGLEWIYWHYGPYTKQIQNTVDKMIGNELAERKFDTDRISGSSYTPLSDFKPEQIGLDTTIELYANSVFTSWQNKDTNKILDYVYTDSLPMFNIERGQSLCFENITKRQEQLKRENDWVGEATSQFHKSSRIQALLKKVRKRKTKYKFPQPEVVFGTTLHIEGFDEEDNNNY